MVISPNVCPILPRIFAHFPEYVIRAFGEKRAQPSCELPHYEVYLLMESVVSLFASISLVGIEKYAEKIGGITWRLQHFSAGGD